MTYLLWKDAKKSGNFYLEQKNPKKKKKKDILQWYHLDVWQVEIDMKMCG